jgi:UDP-N-acetylmuramoylalanine--D-glutamate ligase
MQMKRPQAQPEAMPSYAGRRALVIGLGKSGASSVRYLARGGADIAVTDTRADPPGLAEARAAAPAAAFRLAGFAAPAPLRSYDFAVVSPGVPVDDPFVVAARRARVEILGDVELFARAARAPVVGITGSNGKSTVTALVGAMAQAAGLRAGVGGNLGTPALDLLDPQAQLYVLELSSFQLETTSHLRLAAATVLNLSPDHLDRHGSLEAYGDAKARIFTHARIAVINRDDAATANGADQAPHIVSFGLDPPAPGQYGLTAGADPWLAGPASDPADPSVPLVPAAQLGLRGRHNAANALAALALADAAGIARSGSLSALKGFAGLPHRCALVAEFGGVSWIDDSKGTNVGATLAALHGFAGPLIWLGGGQGKGQDFRALREALRGKARAALLFGQDAERIAQDLGDAVPVRRLADLAEAVTAAQSIARPGDCVLLSPACASLDQFRNYEERGRRFAELVREISDRRAGA